MSKLHITKNHIITSKHEKPILIDLFYLKNDAPKPIVIFCHGYKGFKDWGAWNIMAKTLAEAGFLFLKFNFSHNGGTVEQPIDFPDLEAFGNNNYTKELDDLETVIDWGANNANFIPGTNTSHITLVGHSRGGGIAILKAEEDHRVTQVISLASICDFEKRTATTGDLKQWKKAGVKYVENGRTKQQMPHFYQFYEDVISNRERLSIKRAVTHLKIPQLIIHGEKDTSISVNEAHQLHTWNPASELIIIEGTNHVFGASHPWEKEKMPFPLELSTNHIIQFINKINFQNRKSED